MAKIYVASSWRNAWQPEVVNALRAIGHEVFDFRHTWKGYDAFRWSDIDEAWQDSCTNSSTELSAALTDCFHQSEN